MIIDMSRNRAEEVSKDLIPGLPSDLAMECLVRVPYQFHSDMKSVCRSWRSLLSNSSFIKERRRCSKAELLLCLVQPLSPPNQASKAVGDTETLLVVEEKSEKKRVSITPRFGLSVYNATTATWNRVAFPHQLQIPLFCECVVVQDAGKILLIGGWDPETLQPVKDVYVLEGSGSRRWRRGASMKETRSFFACASVGSTKVYVAGGHDEQKSALRSAEVYDVERDEWSTLPSMDEGRDECQGFSMGMGLGFFVLSGYATESQGRFQRDGEVYDPVTMSWSRIENVWPFLDTSPRGRTVVDTRCSSRLSCFTDRELQSQCQWESRDGSRKWKVDVEVLQLPTSGSSVYVGSSGGEAVVMIGGRRESVGVMMKKTETEKNVGKWSRVHDIPFGFSTLPFSHASIYV